VQAQSKLAATAGAVLINHFALAVEQTARGVAIVTHSSNVAARRAVLATGAYGAAESSDEIGRLAAAAAAPDLLPASANLDWTKASSRRNSRLRTARQPTWQAAQARAHQ